ncbi:hypothetical protein TNCV_2539481 [Trichonephila clavipes]|nr:hypothetical protein TNCV_2539481 [Trichonephila clavipes]
MYVARLKKRLNTADLDGLKDDYLFVDHSNKDDANEIGFDDAPEGRFVEERQEDANLTPEQYLTLQFPAPGRIVFIGVEYTLTAASFSRNHSILKRTSPL